MRDIEEVAFAFAEACDEAKVPYAFVGGLAVMAWGSPRATMDIDSVVDLARSRIGPLVVALDARELQANVEDFLDSLTDGSHVTVHDRRSSFHVDVKLADSPTVEDEIRNARAETVDGHVLRFAGPEDTIAWKLRFGAPQDLQDARSILVRQEGRLDMARLRAVAARLGVAGVLADLMARG